jgi:parvulin-like peptidyl-prolyl isomerase
MRSLCVKGLVAIVATAGLLAFVDRMARGADPEAPKPVVRIGEVTVEASTIKKALAGVPAFELQALGTTKFDILKKYVEEAIVREALMAEAARKRGALEDRSVQLHIRKTLAAALVRKELSALGRREDVPVAEVQAYYDAHVGEYRTPERVRIWHLVVATKEAADAALVKVKADPTRESWPKLVNELSLDPNSKRSSGDLGFVSADGKTTEPKVVVPAELVTAAFGLKDGEIAPNPVKTSAGYHVLWRRGSVPPTVRTMADETPTIRELLFEKKRENAYKALMERLRGPAKVEIDEEILPIVSVDVGPRPTPKPHNK